MSRMRDLPQIVRDEVESYSGPSLSSTFYTLLDDVQQHYAVAIVPDHPRRFKSRIMLMARVLNDVVIIDEDTTERPLVDALLRAGVPREKIVLAYMPEQPHA